MMKKKINGILLTLCMFLMPAAVNAADTDTLTVNSNQEISADATYGALRITDDAVLTVKKGVTLTIDGNKEITKTSSNTDVNSAVVYLTDGNIILEEDATLNIINATENVYAAFRTKGNSNVTLNGATLNVSDNKTRGMDNTLGLTMTMTNSTLKVNNNTLNGMNGTTGAITAINSTIEAKDNALTGLNGKFILKGNTEVNVTNNGLSGINFADGSIITDEAIVTAMDNNTTNNPDKADVIITKTLTINSKGGLAATTVAPMKKTWGDLAVIEGSKLVIDGEEAVAIVGLYSQVCNGAATDENCAAENLVANDTELVNGVYITTNEDLEMEAVIGGTIAEGLELPSEVTKVTVLDTVTGDINIVVANNTVIENNSSHKVNAKVGETTVVVEAGKTQTITEQTTTPPTTDTEKEELPPKTGDINLLVILATIIAGLGLTGFVGKKIYAKLN